MSFAAKRHLSRVAALGCALCKRLGYGQSPAELHHIREGQGMAQRAQDWLVVPLCPEHHRGTGGIHGTRSAFKQAKCSELDLLADTLSELLK